MPRPNSQETDAARHESHAAAASHDEWLMDEAIRGSFPASDPASPSQPGSLLNVRYAADADRALASAQLRDRAMFWRILAGCAIFAAGYLAGRGRR